MTGRFPIEEITPVLAGGRYPAKAVVGELVPVTARAYREGHAALGCTVLCWGPDGRPGPAARMRPAPNGGADRWHATIRPDAVGAWRFAVEAFDDPYLTWRDAIAAKVAAGQDAADLDTDLAEGAALLETAVTVVPATDQDRVRAAARALRDPGLPLEYRLGPALALADLLWAYPVRRLVTRGDGYPLWVDRERALFSAWYEFFPRSETAAPPPGQPPRHGTLATAADRLAGVAAMGFDVVYLPPIHPIGRVNRKGRNNSLVAGPDDVGSPWAVGAAEGGHDTVHPDLGTEDDFRRFLATADTLGLEVAMDLALQCAPDHPWVESHPEWFTTRVDGTIAYAENPPKRYQDIYPLNFDQDPAGLRAEILRVVRHWIGLGVRIFRVDNPHTKPFDFWHWLIWEVKRTDPDVLFLAEAFTKPSVLYGLGRIGFTQSYTYFAWRDSADELREYCAELLDAVDHTRPNFWPTTPDILPGPLQRGGPPMFMIRAVLAALLSPSWGVYAGYELCEAAALPGTEEYLDSEKFELRPRDWAGAQARGTSLAPFLGRLNAVRRNNPALHRFRNLRFHQVDNPALLCWSKRDPDSGNTVLVVCSLDPYAAQWGNTTLDLPALGLDPADRFTVRDELTGERYDWGRDNVVGLDPGRPAHVFTVHGPGAGAYGAGVVNGVGAVAPDTFPGAGGGHGAG